MQMNKKLLRTHTRKSSNSSVQMKKTLWKNWREKIANPVLDYLKSTEILIVGFLTIKMQAQECLKSRNEKCSNGTEVRAKSTNLHLSLKWIYLHTKGPLSKCI